MQVYVSFGGQKKEKENKNICFYICFFGLYERAKSLGEHLYS